MARANTYTSTAPGVFYYPDRKWQHVPDGMTYTFLREGAPQIDARDNVYYMAAGNSRSMMDKNRPGLAVTLDLSRRLGRVPRRREERHAARTAQDPGEQLLVRRGLRCAEPLGAAEWPALPSDGWDQSGAFHYYEEGQLGDTVMMANN
jgi:hypothetical protein